MEYFYKSLVIFKFFHIYFKIHRQDNQRSSQLLVIREVQTDLSLGTGLHICSNTRI
jgi:hypothetical protein